MKEIKLLIQLYELFFMDMSAGRSGYGDNELSLENFIKLLKK